MKSISREDSIDCVCFSNRTKNCMRRHNINTIGDILDYPINDWDKIENMGQKSVFEVLSFLNEFIQANDSCMFINRSENVQNSTIKTFYNYKGQLVKDVEISKCNLPTRAINCFKKIGYIYLSEIIDLFHEEANVIEGMGLKTNKQIIDCIENYDYILVEDISCLSDDVKWVEENAIYYIKELIRFTKLSFNRISKEIIICHHQYPEARGESIIYLIYGCQIIRDEFKKYISSYLENNNGEISKYEFERILPYHLSNTTILEEILLELEFENKIIIENNIIKGNYISVQDYIRTIPNEKIKKILEYRILNGETLESIGQKYNVSRERIRQIIEKEINKFPRVKEDKYLYLFETYNFSLEDFKLSFGESDFVFIYLTIKNKGHDKKEINDILLDDKVIDSVKKCVEKAIYKNYITLDGIHIEKKRPQLVHYYVRTYCKEKIQYEEFKKQYNDFVANHDLEKEDLLLESRTYENHLSSCNYVLWNQWSIFRYYNILEYQYQNLFEQLNLEQYHNMEMSTLKLFRDNLELMQEYDILDEYELHNLLKKVCKLYNIDTIHFGKMPTISFGKVDRDNQILELLIQFAPISIDDLSHKYEELYGVKSATFAANYLRNFNEYLHNGIYVIDQPALNHEQYEYMLKTLTSDIYTYDDLKEIFKQKYINDKDDKINSYTITKLGFKTYTHFVIRNTYDNAYKYFATLLTSKDIFNISNFDSTVLRTAFFYNVLYDLRSKKEILEFEPNQYMNIRRLNKVGITIKNINEFCYEVYNFIGRGKFFTINSLKEDRFNHYLFDLCLDDWFYASLLSETKSLFSYQKMCRTRVLYSGAIKVTLSEFIYSIIEQKEKMEIYDLINHLNDYYDINISRENILTTINSTDLYYNQIMDTVYIDYDIYFEEI